MKTELITDTKQTISKLIEKSPHWILRLSEKYVLLLFRRHADISESPANRRLGFYPDDRSGALHNAYFFHDVVDSLTKIIQVAFEQGVESYARTYKEGNVIENLNLLEKWIYFHLEWTEKEERKIFILARQHLMELRGQSLLYQVKLSEIAN